MKIFLLSFLCLTSAAHAITFKDWQKLSQEAKITYIENSPTDIEVNVTESKLLYNYTTPARFKIIGPQIPTLLKKLSNHKTKLNTEVEDDYHATVGKVEVSASLLFSEDHQFLGTQVQYFQRGCSFLDEEGSYVEQGGHFETLKEAETNNCFDNDVSWSGYSLADDSLTELSESGYMEWSGH